MTASGYSIAELARYKTGISRRCCTTVAKVAANETEATTSCFLTEDETERLHKESV